MPRRSTTFPGPGEGAPMVSRRVFGSSPGAATVPGRGSEDGRTCVSIDHDMRRPPDIASVDAGARGDARSWMDLLVPLQHPDELLDPPGAGLRLLRGLNPEEDRVPVGAVQRFEEGLRLPVLRQRDLKIFR